MATAGNFPGGIPIAPWELLRLTPEDWLAARAEARRRDLVVRARTDPNAFCEYVLRDEKTQARTHQAEHHLGIQAFFSRERKGVVYAACEHGKTHQVAARILWEIGRNPSVQITYLSGTAAQAEKLLGLVKRYIENSAELREVFPDLRPGTTGEKWTQRAICVRRPYGIKTPTLQSMGAPGPIQGDRQDFLFLDDVISFENTRTPERRKELIDWIVQDAVSRLQEGGKVFLIGTPRTRGDAMDYYSTTVGWPTVRYPAIREDGFPLWPEKWTLARLEERKEDMIGTGGVVEFNRQYLLKVLDEDSPFFRYEWFERCMRRGLNVPLAARYDGGNRVVTGVDLAISKKSEADLTCMFTIEVAGKDRRVLACRSGRWGSPETGALIKEVWRLYGSVFAVESNAYQKALHEWVNATPGGESIRIRDHNTDTRKHHPETGIPGLAAEIEAGRWIIPSVEDGRGGVKPASKELALWIDECQYHTPSAHTGDRLVASWIAREMARQVGGYGPIRGLNV